MIFSVHGKDCVLESRLIANGIETLSGIRVSAGGDFRERVNRRLSYSYANSNSDNYQASSRLMQRQK
jgi:hypothetical protein